MQTKQGLTILGTLLLLVGVFGYIFPHLPSTTFHNNENLFHVVAAILSLGFASAVAKTRNRALLAYAVIFWVLGLYGFFASNPDYLHIKSYSYAISLDTADNYLHIVFGLAYAWTWLRFRKS